MPRFKSATTFSFRPDSATVDRVQLTDTGLVVSKDSGHGIKVDTVTPTWGWKDLLGYVNPKNTAPGALVRTLYIGTDIYDWAMTVNDVCDFNFHIPHDYVPNSNMYIHVHWSHNGTAISGNIQFTFYHTYAKGHNQADFYAQKTITTTTYNTTNVATTPQYRHRIEETQFSSAGGSATLCDSGIIEVDGVVMGQIKLTTAPTVSGGSVFLHYVDLHYQSTNMTTKNKAPNFYT